MFNRISRPGGSLFRAKVGILLVNILWAEVIVVVKSLGALSGSSLSKSGY
jgi:hypothetical protein